MIEHSLYHGKYKAGLTFWQTSAECQLRSNQEVHYLLFGAKELLKNRINNGVSQFESVEFEGLLSSEEPCPGGESSAKESRAEQSDDAGD